MFLNPPVPLAWRNLMEKPWRLATSLCGVAFAVILIFIEVGFMNAVYDSQTQLVRSLNADLIVTSPFKINTAPSRPFPHNRLIQSLNFEGVQAAYPVYLDDYNSVWKNAKNGIEYPIIAVAFDPSEPAFLDERIQRFARRLHDDEAVLIDGKSRDFYGELKAGQAAEFNGKQTHIVGVFEMGSAMRWDGVTIMSDQAFFEYFAFRNASQVDLGLLKLAPGVDPEKVQRELQAALGEDVAIRTKEEMEDLIRVYWGQTKAIGKVFSAGAAVGFLIGVMICYQILFSGVTERLPQYATLRAIGYSNAYLFKIVLQEALLLSILGFVPGVLVSLAAYRVLEAFSGLAMNLTWARMIPVLLLTIGMCCVSGVIAARKAMRLDPAEVF